MLVYNCKTLENGKNIMNKKEKYASRLDYEMLSNITRNHTVDGLG